MSKYNNIKSIPIDSLSSDELKIAIKEWSEDDTSMEKLLWTLYNNNIETNVCHAGSGSFIGFYYDKNNNTINEKLINTTLSLKGSQVLLLPDGGNPLSGDNWYKPTINLFFRTTSQRIADSHFDMLTNTINNDDVNKIVDTSTLLEILDFFINKYTNLLFRIEHSYSDAYIFTIEGNTKENSDLYNYLNSILIDFNLIKFEDTNHKNWEYITYDINDINLKLKEIIKLLNETYSIPIPTNIDETDNFNTKAHLMRKKSIDEFNAWLEIEQRHHK